MSDLVVLVATTPEEYADYVSLFPNTLRGTVYREATLEKTQGMRIHRAFITEEASKDQDVVDTLRQILISQSYSAQMDSYPVVLSMTDDMRDLLKMRKRVHLP